MEPMCTRNRIPPFSAFLILGLLAACSDQKQPDDDISSIRAPESATIASAEEALRGAHVPTLDPETLNDAEVRNTAGGGPYCAFLYTSSSKPVLAVSPQPPGQTTNAVVKINGKLLKLQSVAGQEATQKPLILTADPVRISIVPDPRDNASANPGSRTQAATMVFEVGKELKVGYGGYLRCAARPPTSTM